MGKRDGRQMGAGNGGQSMRAGADKHARTKADAYRRNIGSSHSHMVNKAGRRRDKRRRRAADDAGYGYAGGSVDVPPWAAFALLGLVLTLLFLMGLGFSRVPDAPAFTAPLGDGSAKAGFRASK